MDVPVCTVCNNIIGKRRYTGGYRKHNLSSKLRRRDVTALRVLQVLHQYQVSMQYCY